MKPDSADALNQSQDTVAAAGRAAEKAALASGATKAAGKRSQ